VTKGTATATRRGFNQLIDTRYGPMLCNRNDVYVSQAGLIAYGEYSELEIAFVRQFVPVGGCVIQVGAHIGSLTIPLAKAVGPDGMLVAFEPQRLLYQCLTANVALQSLTHVITEHAAVGAEAGYAYVPTHDPDVSFNTGGVRIDHQQTAGEKVRVRTLDAYLDPPRLDLLHADVEGMEEEVLRGSEQLIRRHRPVLYVEAIEVEKRPALFQYMASLGYRLWWHTPPMFNPDNYAGNPFNLLRGISSLNVLGWPIERPLAFTPDEHTQPITNA
jgi:FkbM family methyltransferase